MVLDYLIGVHVIPYYVSLLISERRKQERPRRGYEGRSRDGRDATVGWGP